MEKWKEQVNSEDTLKRVTARRFIDILRTTETITDFDLGLYFKLVEKIMVYDHCRLIFSLLDDLEIEQ